MKNNSITCCLGEILKLHKQSTKNFVRIHGEVIEIDPQSSVKDMVETIKRDHAGIADVRFFDQGFIEYSNAVLLQHICETDFVMKLNNRWYAVLTLVDHPLFLVDSTSTYEEHWVQEYCKSVGLNRRDATILGWFCGLTINSLEKNLDEAIDRRFTLQVLQKVITRNALTAKSKLVDIETKITFLKEKLVKYEEIERSINKEVTMKFRRRLKLFIGWIMTQIIAIQYATYVAFNWDVTEPVTCLLGILDVAIGYSFWLLTNREYSYPNLKQNYIEKSKESAANKMELNMQDLNETRELIRFLECKKLLYSPKLEDTLKGIELDLKVISTLPNQRIEKGVKI